MIFVVYIYFIELIFYVCNEIGLENLKIEIEFNPSNIFKNMLKIFTGEI